MMLKTSLLKILLVVITAFSLSHGVAAVAATIYVYVDARGSRMIANHQPSEVEGYRLLSSYQVDDNFGRAKTPKKRLLRPRKSKYDQLIKQTADQFGVESALVKAVIQVESAFNPDAVSPAGAAGLMQLMPQTAKLYSVTQVSNPAQNMHGGVHYLSDLLRLYKNNSKLALAAYNAGEKAVAKYNGIPPFPETKAYVVAVLKLLELYRQ